MNVTLNQLGGELFSRLGQLSVELALLAALVLLASRLLPLQSPALRHLVWVVVLLKPIVAFAISSPWTLCAPLALTLQPEGSLLRYAPSFASVEISNTVAVANVRSASLLMAGWRRCGLRASLYCWGGCWSVMALFGSCGAGRGYIATDIYLTCCSRRAGRYGSMPMLAWRLPTLSALRS